MVEILRKKTQLLCEEEKKAGRPVMCDRKVDFWDMRVTDQWLVDQTESKASQSFKKLTFCGPTEERFIGDVSLERI